ncbi:hypothetical protein PFISCL1PPCAC_22819, partial [Pristionchus fissidentatus]
QSLEEEEIRDEPFYHAKITRVRAEAIVRENGDFLVRDSISNAGEFVLTAFWKKPLHFQINHERDRMGNKVYMFEEEEFSTVSSLVHFYRTHRRPITLSTGCQISRGMEKDGGEEILNAKGGGAELEAQYAKIFRPTAAGARPAYGASPGLSKTAMVNWASRSSLASSASVSNLSRPVALPPPVPASLIRSGLPMPKRSPPQMRKKEEEEDYCEMDYDAMEPDPLHSPLIGGTRSVFNMTMPSHMRDSILRPTQSLEKLTFAAENCHTLPNRKPRSPSSVHSEIIHTTTALHSPISEREPGNRQSDLSADSGRRSGDSSGSRPASATTGDEEDDYDLPKADRDQLFIRSDSRLSKSSVPTTNTSSEGHGSGASTSRDESDYDEPKDMRRESPMVFTRERPTIATKPVLMAKPPTASKPALPPKPSSVGGDIVPPQLHRLRNFVIDHSERELAENLGREDCGLLGLIGPDVDARLAGAGALLLPSGHARRSRMKTRCRNSQLAVVFSIVSADSLLESARVLSLWIKVAGHAIKRNGNQFTFVNVMRALSSEKLNITALWERVDALSRQDFRLLAKSFSTITTRGEHPLDSVACSIPFLHPLLDIFDGGVDVESSYLDRSSPAKELESTFFWLDVARDWCSMGAQYSQRCAAHFASSFPRTTKINLLTESNLATVLPAGEQLHALFVHLPTWR